MKLPKNYRPSNGWFEDFLKNNPVGKFLYFVLNFLSAAIHPWLSFRSISIGLVLGYFCGAIMVMVGNKPAHYFNDGFLWNLPFMLGFISVVLVLGSLKTLSFYKDNPLVSKNWKQQIIFGCLLMVISFGLRFYLTGFRQDINKNCMEVKNSFIPEK